MMSASRGKRRHKEHEKRHLYYLVPTLIGPFAIMISVVYHVFNIFPPMSIGIWEFIYQASIAVFVFHEASIIFAHIMDKINTVLKKDTRNGKKHRSIWTLIWDSLRWSKDYV